MLIDYLKYFIPIITAIISSIVTYFTTKANNKTQVELALKDYEIKLIGLQNDLTLRDKEIEELKIAHELDLKSKEAEIMNPIMGEFMKEAVEDPKVMKRLFELKELTDEFENR